MVQRACVAGAIQVGTYDQFRETFSKMGVKDTFTNVFYASMASGLLFAGFSMPLETAKNKMAFQKADPITGLTFRHALTILTHTLTYTYNTRFYHTSSHAHIH